MMLEAIERSNTWKDDHSRTGGTLVTQGIKAFWGVRDIGLRVETWHGLFKLEEN